MALGGITTKPQLAMAASQALLLQTPQTGMITLVTLRLHVVLANRIRILIRVFEAGEVANSTL